MTWNGFGESRRDEKGAEPDLALLLNLPNKNRDRVETYGDGEEECMHWRADAATADRAENAEAVAANIVLIVPASSSDGRLSFFLVGIRGAKQMLTKKMNKLASYVLVETGGGGGVRDTISTRRV